MIAVFVWYASRRARRTRGTRRAYVQPSPFDAFPGGRQPSVRRAASCVLRAGQSGLVYPAMILWRISWASSSVGAQQIPPYDASRLSRSRTRGRALQLRAPEIVDAFLMRAVATTCLARTCVAEVGFREARRRRERRRPLTGVVPRAGNVE